MKSTDINTGYKRLGVVVGVVAAVVSTIIISSNNAKPTFWGILSIAAIFFVVHFVTFVGIGWTRANIRNSDKVYSTGARAVTVLAPISLIIFISYAAFAIFVRSRGLDLATLKSAALLVFMLAGPVFLVIVVILAVVYVIDGFRQAKG